MLGLGTSFTNYAPGEPAMRVVGRADYEAVIEKNGKEWGFKFDANGKMLGKHDESKEKGEKGEKY